jgi:hypothetical protein
VFKKQNYIFFIIPFLLLSGEVIGQTSSYGELQAAYLFNFSKYIKWPIESKTFVIGIYGKADILGELQRILSAKKAGGKEILLKEITSVDKLLECNIIYLPESNSRSLAVIKETVDGKSILIVTEEDLIKKGATISFVVEDDRLKFKLKQTALAKASLTASEGLLRLAILL